MKKRKLRRPRPVSCGGCFVLQSSLIKRSQFKLHGDNQRYGLSDNMRGTGNNDSTEMDTGFQRRNSSSNFSDKKIRT